MREGNPRLTPAALWKVGHSRLVPVAEGEEKDRGNHLPITLATRVRVIDEYI